MAANIPTDSFTITHLLQAVEGVAVLCCIDGALHLLAQLARIRFAATSSNKKKVYRHIPKE